MAKGKKLSASQSGPLYMGTMPDDLATLLVETGLAEEKALKNIGQTKASHNVINKERSSHAVPRKVAGADDFGVGETNPFADAIAEVVKKVNANRGEEPARAKKGKTTEIKLGPDDTTPAFSPAFQKAFENAFPAPFVPAF